MPFWRVSDMRTGDDVTIEADSEEAAEDEYLLTVRENIVTHEVPKPL